MNMIVRTAMACALLAAATAHAAWPEKPVRIVVTFAAGGPAGLPKEVTDKLAKALADIVADRAIVKRFEEPGIGSVKMDFAEFGSFVAKQINDWAQAIKAADVKN